MRAAQGAEGGACACGEGERRQGQRRCLACHSAYMRKWRKGRPMGEEQRLKDIARSYAGVYLRRGKIAREPCVVCGGTEKMEMHHADYTRPLDVVWMCRVCHVAHHGRPNVPA